MKNIILKVYGVITVLLAADLLAYGFFRISLQGYYSDVALVWLWFLGSFTSIILFWKKILAKLLLGGIILGLVLSMLPMGMPFFAFILSTTPFGLWLKTDLNSEYRAQIVGYSVMTYPVLQVIEKKGLIEKQIFQCDDHDLLNDNLEVKIRYAKDILFESETDSTLTLTLFYGGPNKTLTFDKSSGKIIKKKVLFR
ncbi:hypothetical protein [Sphingobacterium spiritivorum]|uniref:hypothetical protein n=1 Tax=Sphingobacterium spiritivorum TaxID=258 RepID=UPI001918F8B6|nr:hypothetical protein [Sphingobacterium spiritivorum]QQT25760.1 hypothetical protein I6J02_18905 [Sphingobacterium spiritivorum]